MRRPDLNLLYLSTQAAQARIASTSKMAAPSGHDPGVISRDVPRQRFLDAGTISAVRNGKRVPRA